MGELPADITVEVDAAGITVTVVGDLDLASGRTLMDRTVPLLDQGEGLELTLDLAKVEFCDSSGITALVRLRQRCGERGWRLRTVNMHPAVRRIVIDFGGLGEHLNVLDQ